MTYQDDVNEVSSWETQTGEGVARQGIEEDAAHGHEKGHQDRVPEPDGKVRPQEEPLIGGRRPDLRGQGDRAA